MTWPRVISELETLQQVLAGASLARYGDGELHLCAGHSIPCQRHDSALQGRLRGILRAPPGRCLVGIPNLHSETPKATFWQPFQSYAHLLADRPYASAFVSRPDSAPWINTAEYWAALESLWMWQDVTLVRGSGRSLTAADLIGARSVTEITAPRQHAWSEYQQLLVKIGTPKRALLCLGPTATVMAVDLCAHGVHAVDLGHVGNFLRKYRRGEPMTMTAADRTAA